MVDERLADAWLCLHPSASTSEFVQWVRALPSNQSRSTKLQARSFGANRVVVIWARDDVPDGGRAALYVRENARWTRQGSVDLEWTPEVVATLGERDLVIREQNAIPRLTAGNVRVLRVEANRLVQQLFERDIDNSKIVSRTKRQVVISFERIPRRFSTDETSVRLAYTIVINSGAKAPVATIQSSTPGLEAMEQFCASTSAAGARTAAADITAPQLPDCTSVRVTQVRSIGPGRQDLDIEAPLVCERRDGMLESVQQAVLSVARIRGTYRVARLGRAGCKVVRARGSGEAL